MSLAQQAAGELRATQEYFNRSTRNLTEAESAFTPTEGTFTAAEQVAHVAQTIDWFMEGGFRPEGFSMEWDAMEKEVKTYKSLATARKWLDEAFARAIAKAESCSDADLTTPLPEGPIMGGMPRMAVFGAIVDHTAHHRGALTVYARLNKIVPPMPYMDM
ncbi:MAG: DinB family protein [Bryobacteraceae bacterium]